LALHFLKTDNEHMHVGSESRIGVQTPAKPELAGEEGAVSCP
jgi:hypothetical protein